MRLTRDQEETLLQEIMRENERLLREACNRFAEGMTDAEVEKFIRDLEQPLEPLH